MQYSALLGTPGDIESMRERVVATVSRLSDSPADAAFPAFEVVGHAEKGPADGVAPRGVPGEARSILPGSADQNVHLFQVGGSHGQPDGRHEYEQSPKEIPEACNSCRLSEPIAQTVLSILDSPPDYEGLSVQEVQKQLSDRDINVSHQHLLQVFATLVEAGDAFCTIDDFHFARL